jgi:hypothetical protein
MMDFAEKKTGILDSNKFAGAEALRWQLSGTQALR